jgi:hypothetical protein
MNLPPSKYTIQQEIETFLEINEMYVKSIKKKPELSDTLEKYVKKTLKSAGFPISQTFSGIQVRGLSFSPEREPEKVEVFMWGRKLSKYVIY